MFGRSDEGGGFSFACWDRPAADNSLEPFIRKSGLLEDRGMKTTLGLGKSYRNSVKGLEVSQAIAMTIVAIPKA